MNDRKLTKGQVGTWNKFDGKSKNGCGMELSQEDQERGGQGTGTEEACSGFERAFGFVREGGKSYWGGEKVYGKSGEKNVDIVLMLAHNGCISKRGIGMTLDKKQHTASVGLAGCVGLLSLLLVSLVTPLTSGRAHAEGGDEDINNEGADEEFGGFDGEGVFLRSHG